MIQVLGFTLPAVSARETQPFPAALLRSKQEAADHQLNYSTSCHKFKKLNTSLLISVSFLASIAEFYNNLNTQIITFMIEAGSLGGGQYIFSKKK